MRRQNFRRAAALGLFAAALAPSLGGHVRGDDKKPATAKKKETIVLKIDETVGELAKVPPLTEIKVEGVGLVVGLDNTGSNPSPTGWRTKLKERMQKAGLENSEKWLASPTTSLVIVRGKVPAGITTEDVFDVEVELDPASTTTSLAGGQLIMTELFRVEYGSKGEILPQGQLMGRVSGSVMTGSTAKPEDLKSGQILGGGRSKDDLPYILIVNEKRKSARTAKLVEDVVNSRFSRSKGVEQQGMAVAKTDQFLQLRIPRNYHHNQYRYFQVVENLPVVQSPELQAARIDKWGKLLLDPKTAGQAALRLECLGRNAIPVLKAALGNPHPQVRFFAAEALAYLGDDSGVDALSDAAKNRPEFRTYALAALAAMDQLASNIRLRELMSSADPTVRYGAFNALRIVDKYDPFLGQVRVRHDEPEQEAQGADALAMQIAAPRRKKPRLADPFDLYVVDSEGPPLVHIAKTRRCEIVIFGKGQMLQTPAVLGVGSIQINAVDGDDRAQVSRIGVESVDGPDQKVVTSLELAQIIREAANVGATYPEILAILQAAERQKNLPEVPGGVAPALIVDALPAALAAYEEAQVAGRDATAKTDSAVQKTSGEKPAKQGLINRMFRRGDK